MLGRFIAFALAILAGIVTSQGPEFAQQYRQRLGGAVDELARVIDHFNSDAAANGVDQAGALAVMARNGEPLVRQQAVSMAETILRYHRLTDQQQAFETTPPFQRILVFMREYDSPLVNSTLKTFEPAVPATAEGIVFAAGGFAIVYFLLRFLGLVFRPRRHRHRHHHGHPLETA
jgi:hypothetical protein